MLKLNLTAHNALNVIAAAAATARRLCTPSTESVPCEHCGQPTLSGFSVNVEMAAPSVCAACAAMKAPQ